MWPFGKRKRLLKKPGISQKSAQNALGLTTAAKKGQARKSSRQEADAAAKALEQMGSKETAKPVKPKTLPKKPRPAKQRLATVLKRVKPGKTPLAETLKTNPAFRQSLAGALGKAGFKNPDALIEKVAKKLEAGQSLKQIIQELEKS